MIRAFSKHRMFLAGFIMAAFSVCVSTAATAREEIRIVGSSTVYPFVTVVAERFSAKTDARTPIIEATGTGGGMKLFCGGTGDQFPDITGASRKIKQSEYDACTKNGVVNPIEIKIGKDAIVLADARDANQYSLTRQQIYQALAREVLVKGVMVKNPYKQWSDIDPSLPKTPIEVYGPPPTSGTRDAFVELVMETGCEETAGMAKAFPDANTRKAKCALIREDGVFIEAGENDNLIIQKLLANKQALGIFGYSFLEQNLDKVQAATIEGVSPTFDKVSSGQYPIWRPLYVYVKREQIASVPGIKQFLKELVSESAISEEGYLAGKGLIAVPKEERAKIQKAVSELK